MGRMIYLAGALALLAAQSGAAGEVIRYVEGDEPQRTKSKRKAEPKKYRDFCGPPEPKSRQHRRALERQAAKVRLP